MLRVHWAVCTLCCGLKLFPVISSISINSHGSSRTATMSLIFLFHSSLLTVNWTTAGNVVPHQPMMSSTHLLGGRLPDLSPSTVPSTTVFISLSSSILQICPNNCITSSWQGCRLLSCLSYTSTDDGHLVLPADFLEFAYSVLFQKQEVYFCQPPWRSMSLQWKQQWEDACCHKIKLRLCAGPHTVTWAFQLSGFPGWSSTWFLECNCFLLVSSFQSRCTLKQPPTVHCLLQ